MRESAEQFTDLVFRKRRCPHRARVVHLVTIAAADLLARQVTLFDKVGQDAVRLALRQPDALRDLTHRQIRVAVDLDQQSQNFCGVTAAPGTCGA